MSAADAIYESLISIGQLGITSPVSTTARFNEINLIIVLRYKGPPVTLAVNPPSAEELVSDSTALNRLSGFLIQQAADRVSVASINGTSHVRLHFDH